MANDSAEFVYSGTDNLEVMAEAQKYNRFLVDLVVKYRAAAVKTLDFGAGIGTFSELVKGRDPNRTVDCLEVDAKQAEVLQRKGFRNFTRSEDIPDGTYDYIYSLNVFEHIEDDFAAAREAHRILREGGRLFVYVPAFSVLFGSMDRKVGHFRRYSRARLVDIVAGAGFQVQTDYYVDSLGFLATLVYNAGSRQDGSINKDSVRMYDRFVFPMSRMLDVVTSRLLGKNAVIVATK